MDQNTETESEQSESDEEDLYEINKINANIKALKEELEGHHNKMKVNEYNKKRAIFEYLKLLDKNGAGKVKASLNAAQMVFIDGGV